MCSGSILGTVDERGLLRHGPGCAPLGAVAAVTAVRDLVGTLMAVLTPEGAVLGVDLEPLDGCHVGDDGAVWAAADNPDGRGAVLGFAQGQPPPLGLLAGSDGRQGVVQWGDQRARLEGRGWVGSWDTSGGGRVLDESGAEVEAGLAFSLPKEGPPEDLPQAVDSNGVFVGHVLPSRAVIGPDGAQVCLWSYRVPRLSSARALPRLLTCCVMPRAGRVMLCLPMQVAESVAYAHVSRCCCSGVSSQTLDLSIDRPVCVQNRMHACICTVREHIMILARVTCVPVSHSTMWCCRWVWSCQTGPS